MATDAVLHIAHMAAMGLLVGAVAPALLLAVLRVAPGFDRWTVHPAVALPGFVVLHAAVTLAGDRGAPPGAVDALGPLLLVLGGMVFWAPVFGVRHRLPDAGRAFYLYTAMPLLDLAGVWVVSSGDDSGGLAMIVGMLPMALVTVVVTWRWITGEERRIALEEAGEMQEEPT